MLGGSRWPCHIGGMFNGKEEIIEISCEKFKIFFRTLEAMKVCK